MVTIIVVVAKFCYDLLLNEINFYLVPLSQILTCQLK